MSSDVALRTETPDSSAAPRRPPPVARVPTTGRRSSRPADRSTCLAFAALVGVTIVGAAIRARGFTDEGLFRDDAWVALSSRVGLGTAVHMWVTAPGFGLLERTWILLGPARTWWYQVPDFVYGVSAVPAIYFLARYVKLGRVVGLVLAGFVCVSPVCVTYSTRVKEYPVDFLLSCLLIAVGEAARRRPERRPVLVLAVTSVLAFFVSASVAPVVGAVWLALVGSVRRGRPARSAVLAAAGTATVCGGVAAVFYAHLSPSLTRFWSMNASFVVHTSPRALLDSLVDVAGRLLGDLVGLAARPGSGLELLLIALCIVLSVLAVRHDRAMVGPALAVLLAFAGSALERVPLGTGRTDEYLYPAMLLLVAGGATQVLAPFRLRVTLAASTTVRLAVLVLVAVVVVPAGVLVQQSWGVARYPGADVPALAAELHRVERPGDRVFVNEVTRYPWAFYEDAPLRVRFGSDWSAGFTVVSSDPDVFIAPSEDYEQGADPSAWARDVSGSRRLWYVWTPPLSLASASYGALLHDGWRPVREVRAPGVAATLLVRAGAA